MGKSEFATYWDHEQVVFCHDKDTGLRAIIAIHDTTLGPALGGCRFWNYADQEEALTDVLRLSRGMTYKAAVAGLPLGGGKAVIIGDPTRLKSEQFFRAFGRFVQNLKGRYITAEDVNVKVGDMNQVALETDYVTGITSVPGGSGDPSPVTAAGVFAGLKAAVKFRFKRDSLKDLKVGIQGCGSVGSYLARHLHNAGAKLVISDIDQKNLKQVQEETGAEVAESDSIYDREMDVFAPCALGGILNDETLSRLKARVIAGGANNQLLDEVRHMKVIQDNHILYAPDYVINAGGLINVYTELKGYNPDQAKSDADNIYETLTDIFKKSEQSSYSTLLAANELAEENIAKARKQGQASITHSYDNQRWINRSKRS